MPSPVHQSLPGYLAIYEPAVCLCCKYCKYTTNTCVERLLRYLKPPSMYLTNMVLIH